jgi:mRNA interferase RelE/StbE
MKTAFTNKFLQQVSSGRFTIIHKKIEKVILDVEKATTLSQIKNLKKLKGQTKYYRIRLGDYRIGLYIEDQVIEFTTIGNRKDIYKHFP